jgi:hypothetical protein
VLFKPFHGVSIPILRPKILKEKITFLGTEEEVILQTNILKKSLKIKRLLRRKKYNSEISIFI